MIEKSTDREMIALIGKDEFEVWKTLKSLTEKNLITKREFIKDNVRRIA